MSRQTENFFKEFHEYAAEKGAETEEELQQLLKEFVTQYNASLPVAVTEENAQTADDYLELAENAKSKKQALKYAQMALEAEPDNIDAAVTVTEMTAKTPDELYENLCSLIVRAKERMTEEGWFDEENIGSFWQILETRPYMRLLNKYAQTTKELGMLRLTVATCEEMLRLCENDNLGIRYSLMHLYTFLEEEAPAIALMEKYEKEESTQFLLPLSILYFKLGNKEKSEQYLQQLKAVNKDTVAFFKAISKGNLDTNPNEINAYGYRPNTIEEFIVETHENIYLFISSAGYFDWALRKLTSRKKKQS
ncbi:MAG TPA: hypothetical protein DEO95_02810 [Ruminococcaceae bacterium]|nr:hypothetical protein [Oscillospiraceae bacterium]